MRSIKAQPRSVFSATVIATFLAALLAFPAAADHVNGKTVIKKGGAAQLVMPIMNPERGKKIFVEKGCVACHAVNGVGGHDAPNMDAHNRMGLVHPFDFAAKMWNHAPAMIAAQEGAFGEQVYFTGSELADIIAFVHDEDAQHSFSEKDLTAKARKMMEHKHGGASPPDAHAKEIGHGDKHDDSKSAPHKD